VLTPYERVKSCSVRKRAAAQENIDFIQPVHLGFTQQYAAPEREAEDLFVFGPGSIHIRIVA